MMIFFILTMVLVALYLQKRVLERGLDGLEADHVPQKRLVEVGETFAIDLIVINKSKSIIPFVKVKERLGEEFYIDAERITVREDYRGLKWIEFTLWMKPLEQVRKAAYVEASQRGRYVLRNLIVQKGDFLGLKETAKACGRFNEIVVVPQPVPSKPLEKIFGGFLGDVSARRFIFEDPILTLGYDQYTGREPMKMISWSQSARRNSLLVKKNDYTLEPAVSVILNVETKNLQKEQLLEKCFSLARTVCMMLERENVKYSFSSNAMAAGNLTGPSYIEEGLGTRHYEGILEHLGRATYECRFSMEHLVKQEMGRTTAPGRILITPEEDAESAKLIQQLNGLSGGNLLVLRGTEVESWS